MSAPDETSTPDGEVPPSQAIIEAVAEREGVDVTEIEPPAYDPLFTVVNPEALDELFDTTTGTASNAVVELEYEGYEIVVRSHGDVDVFDPSSPDSPNGRIEE
ncbi:HalOD1 output domain-containing protein [Natrinema ejinorense]|uniref:Halobacterial output domain-containing protein n=1 Tax=Natrinema ejinorense TaxID=373386 RepID=A0A2A5QTV2_9EURY|nr:HalOD1 output domain-containing protein [Natrinema ejinorense]PCR90189.1 hypothetical protein CP557_06310 [Natrinema ejinorense]